MQKQKRGRAGEGRERDRGERYPSAELGLAAGGEAGSKVSSAAAGGSSATAPTRAPCPPGRRAPAGAGALFASFPVMRCRPYLCALLVREVAPFVAWRGWTGMGYGARTEFRPCAGPVRPGVWHPLRRARKIEAREKAAWPGSCRLRPGPVQDCFLRSRLAYCNALCNLTTGVRDFFFTYFYKGLQRLYGLGGCGRWFASTPTAPRLGGAGRGSGAPGKGLEDCEARGFIPSPRWGRGGGAADGAGAAALWGGGSISAALQAGEGGCLGEEPGPGGGGRGGRGRGCRRGARSPLLARHDCGTWCRGGGTAAGGRPGPLGIGAETRAWSRSSRCLLLLLCGGNRCTQTKSSCEQGAGRGLKGEPRVQTSAAPGRREQDSPRGPRRRGRAWVQSGTPAFPGFFPGGLRKREPKVVRLSRPPLAGFEASVSRRAPKTASIFLLKGKLNHAFFSVKKSLRPFPQISRKINKVIPRPRPSPLFPTPTRALGMDRAGEGYMGV